MYERFRADPTSVSESWREFFADYRPPSDRTGGADARRTGDGAERAGVSVASSASRSRRPGPPPHRAAPAPAPGRAPSVDRAGPSCLGRRVTAGRLDRTPSPAPRLHRSTRPTSGHAIRRVAHRPRPRPPLDGVRALDGDQPLSRDRRVDQAEEPDVVNRCEVRPAASWPTWRRPSACPPPPACGWCRPSCSRSTAPSSTTSCSGPPAARSASPT